MKNTFVFVNVETQEDVTPTEWFFKPIDKQSEEEDKDKE